MRPMNTLLLLVLAVAVTGCAANDYHYRGPLDEDAMRALDEGDPRQGHCRHAVVRIIVPAADPPGQTLKKDGAREIREGCAPRFDVVRERGAHPGGQYWITFDADSPFVGAKGQPDQGKPRQSFPTAAAAQLRARPFNDHLCTHAAPCKYTIEHRVPNGTSPYPPLDPEIIITR